jgi:hypothetical protein
MTFSDFVTYFENLYLCRVFKTVAQGGPWYRYTAQGEWRGRTAGGCTNNPEKAQFNPQYMLAPSSPCTVFIALKQLETSGQDRPEEYIGFKVRSRRRKVLGPSLLVQVAVG